MKFIALGIVVLALIFSWREIHRPGDIPSNIHFSLQTELQQFIQKYITENVPTATEIRFHRLWTKPVDIDTVDAQFEYSFVSQADGDGTAKTLLAGSARLNRVPSAGTTDEGWTLARVQIDDQTIEFEQGVVIRSDGGAAAELPPETESSSEAAPAPTHKETHH